MKTYAILRSFVEVAFPSLKVQFWSGVTFFENLSHAAVGRGEVSRDLNLFLTRSVSLPRISCPYPQIANSHEA
jgi:hypothetical protein